MTASLQKAHSLLIADMTTITLVSDCINGVINKVMLWQPLDFNQFVYLLSFILTLFLVVYKLIALLDCISSAITCKFSTKQPTNITCLTDFVIFLSRDTLPHYGWSMKNVELYHDTAAIVSCATCHDGVKENLSLHQFNDKLLVNCGTLIHIIPHTPGYFFNFLWLLKFFVRIWFEGD